jgi:hypothetical protein
MSLTTWTTEQLLSLAPDSLMARAAERMVNPYNWLALGHCSDVIWGEYPNHNNPPYHAFATLPDLAFYCDCASRKRPCRHAVSLALMAAREAASFQEAEPPTWVRQHLNGWIDRGAGITAPQTTPSEIEYKEQLHEVKEGMRRFDRWLKDIVHHGLAAVPSQPVALWNEMAASMSDSGMPELAQDIRQLRLVAGRHPGWPEVMLRRLGRFYLLAQGFASYDDLAPESQADLRGAVGWFEDPAYPGEEFIRDRWLVLGSEHTLQGRFNLIRTWLYGLSHRRFAFVNQKSEKEILKPIHLGGTALEATLRFAPGGWPQRAALVELNHIKPDSSPVPGSRSLKEVRTAYGKALGVNPWLRNFPLILQQVQSESDGDRWILRDASGYIMPLPKPFLYGWHLQALSSADNALFGVWNGAQFSPLTVYYDESWLTLHILRGQK